MNIIIKKTVILFTFSLLSVGLFAQYGNQFTNRGFEDWTSRDGYAVSEPVHWHSGGTASGWLSGSMPNTMEQSSQKRPGSLGSKSIRLVPKSVLGVTANGSVTNGRINAGSMSASGSNNYNYTQRAQSDYSTPFSMIPDSITVWACFRCQSSTDKAHVKAVVHGDADFKLVSDGTSTANGDYVWRHFSVPFVNDGPCTDVRYLLLFATTNETAGSGSTNDDLFLDDILLIYNPSLTMGQLASNNFASDDVISIPFTLTGTMSPDNLNASANQVIAQMSDINGDFSNPTELGRITTNSSNSITAQIPLVVDGNYKIRVVSTNYPMIGQNIQEITITNPTYAITATADPANGGVVTGGNTYSAGQTCTLTAIANNGFEFICWTKNGIEVTNNHSHSFTVTGAADYVAHFQLDNVVEHDSSVKLFPNPFGTTISITAEKTINSISVYDLSGRMVKRQIINGTDFILDLSEVGAGAYMLQLDYGDSKSVHRIMKSE